jgi:hypothetical protein
MLNREFLLLGNQKTNRKLVFKRDPNDWNTFDYNSGWNSFGSVISLEAMQWGKWSRNLNIAINMNWWQYEAYDPNFFYAFEMVQPTVVRSTVYGSFIYFLDWIVEVHGSQYPSFFTSSSQVQINGTNMSNVIFRAVYNNTWGNGVWKQVLWMQNNNSMASGIDKEHNTTTAMLGYYSQWGTISKIRIYKINKLPTNFQEFSSIFD